MSEHLPSEERLRELLVGRRIVSVEQTDEVPNNDDAWEQGFPPVGVLTLDNGAVLKLWGHEGSCSCGSGDYVLTELNGVDNVITNVERVDEPGGDDYPGNEDDNYDGRYQIFVYAENRQLLAQFTGSDGNGYYGTGFYLEVSA